MGFQELQTHSRFPPASLCMPKGKPPPHGREDAPCRMGGGQPWHHPWGDTQRGARAPQPRAGGSGGAKARDSRAFSHSLWSQGRTGRPAVPGPTGPMAPVPRPGHGGGHAPLPQDAGGPAQVRPLALPSHQEPPGRRSARRRGFTRNQPILVAQSG